jgi:hypothetical protein
VEAAAIDLLGIDHLTNEVYGFESKRYGRITVEQLEAQYHSTALHEEDIVDNLMMIRISNTYSDALSPLELYEMTRGFWRVDVNRAREVLTMCWLSIRVSSAKSIKLSTGSPVGRRSCSGKKMEHGPRTATNSSAGLPTSPSARDTA